MTGYDVDRHNGPEYADAYWADRARADGENAGRCALLGDLIVRLGLFGDRVLDVGCGDGRVAERLRYLSGGDVYVCGIDQSAAGVRIAVERGAVQRGEVVDLDTWHPHGRYDLVVCTDVLEHVRDPARLAGALCSAAPRLFVSVPDGRFDAFEGHRHFFTPEALAALFPGARIVEHPSGLAAVIA